MKTLIIITLVFFSLTISSVFAYTPKHDFHYLEIGESKQFDPFVNDIFTLPQDTGVRVYKINNILLSYIPDTMETFDNPTGKIYVEYDKFANPTFKFYANHNYSGKGYTVFAIRELSGRITYSYQYFYAKPPANDITLYVTSRSLQPKNLQYLFNDFSDPTNLHYRYEYINYVWIYPPPSPNWLLLL